METGPVVGVESGTVEVGAEVWNHGVGGVAMVTPYEQSVVWGGGRVKRIGENGVKKIGEGVERDNKNLEGGGGERENWVRGRGEGGGGRGGGGGGERGGGMVGVQGCLEIGGEEKV